MIVFPPCKINLGLYVTQKRNDGYHDIESVFYPVPWFDVLEIIEAPDQQFEFRCSGIHLDTGQTGNIVEKAYHLFRETYSIPEVKIHLHKIIPSGAGLGGGSSDAAWALVALNKLFSFGLDITTLAGHAASLGSDCPFFVYNSPMLVTGRGENLHPISLSLKGKVVVIVYPEIHIGTKEAYERLTPQAPTFDLSHLPNLPMSEWQTSLSNDFEKSATSRYEIIGNIKIQLKSKGAIYSSMSGSGSAVYGLFDHPVDSGTWFPGMKSWQGVL